MPDSEPTRMLDGRLLLRQPLSGHRAGTDAVLLAASAAPSPGWAVVDVGSGVGTIGLALALRDPTITVRLIEREPDLARYARENADLNGLGERVEVVEADIFDPETARAQRSSADLVISNPPFFEAGTMRVSAHPLKARAHALHSGMGRDPGHADWLGALIAMLRPHGELLIVHRPAALPALLAAVHNQLGSVCVRPVQSRVGQPAIRVLFGGRKGSRAPFALLDPLVLHDSDGAFTPLAEALHRGGALLPLLPARKSRPRGPASPSF